MVEGEAWKPVLGYEGLYEVSDCGRVRSTDGTTRIVRNDGSVVYRVRRGRILSPAYDGAKNYLHVQLSHGGKSKTVQVHRLVATAFIENPNNLPEVNHKDEVKTNNTASNLEWCDHKYNSNYGSKEFASRGERNSQNKFSEDFVRELRRVFIPGDPECGLTALAKKHGISRTHLCSILKGRRWGWLDA